MSAKEARERFSDVLGTVYYSKEPVIIEKQGRAFAVVVNPDVYDDLVREHRERLFEVVDGIRTKNKGVTAEEAEADATREIEALRRERRATTEQA